MPSAAKLLLLLWLGVVAQLLVPASSSPISSSSEIRDGVSNALSQPTVLSGGQQLTIGLATSGPGSSGARKTVIDCAGQKHAFIVRCVSGVVTGIMCLRSHHL